MSRYFHLLRDSRVSMVTFGNQVNWTMKKGEKMFYDFLRESNESYLFLQSGLNYYIVEARACPPVEEHKELKR